MLSDQQYAELIAAGLHPEIVAFTAPCWARPSTDCSNPYFTGPPDQAYMQDWVTYIHDLAVRYPAAAAIEVWNEPNLDQYFLPRSNPARFTALLKAAHTAIKAVNANIPVISGGLLLSPPIAGSGQVSGGYGAVQFLAAMYADGAKSSMDALGVHIYPSDYVNGAPATWDPVAMQTWLGQIGAVRSAAGEGSQPIWITEMGISTTTEPGWPAATTPQQQATDLSQMIQIAKANPSIRTAIIHGLEDQSARLQRPGQRRQCRLGDLLLGRDREACRLCGQPSVRRLAQLLSRAGIWRPAGKRRLRCRRNPGGGARVCPPRRPVA